MWSKIEESFQGTPVQKRIALFLLENGFGISEDGRVVCNGIEINAASLARVIGIDRRVISYTVKRILKSRELKSIFTKIKAKPFLRDAAGELGLGVVVISVEDASRAGILEEITRCIADNKIPIRQAIADDPYFTEEPKFTVITASPIKGKLVEKLRKIKGVKSLSIF